MMRIGARQRQGDGGVPSRPSMASTHIQPHMKQNSAEIAKKKVVADDARAPAMSVAPDRLRHETVAAPMPHRAEDENRLALRSSAASPGRADQTELIDRAARLQHAGFEHR